MLSQEVSTIVSEVLQLKGGPNSLTEESPLLGSIPEFDSMAVVAVLTSIEEVFGIIVDDDDIDASVFETIGTLTDFVKART